MISPREMRAGVVGVREKLLIGAKESERGVGIPSPKLGVFVV